MYKLQCFTCFGGSAKDCEIKKGDIGLDTINKIAVYGGYFEKKFNVGAFKYKDSWRSVTAEYVGHGVAIIVVHLFNESSDDIQKMHDMAFDEAVKADNWR